MRPIPFFSSADGNANFTGDIAKDFACGGPAGRSGFGFRGDQFAWCCRALEPDGTSPAANQACLRPFGVPGIVLVTKRGWTAFGAARNSERCSIPRRKPGLRSAGAPGLLPAARVRSPVRRPEPPRTPAVLTDCTSGGGRPPAEGRGRHPRTRALKTAPARSWSPPCAAP